MPGAERGIYRLATEFGLGLLFSFLVEQISLGLSGGNQELATVVGLLIGVIGSLALLRVMKYWGSAYIFGWILGALFLIWVGLIDLGNILDFLVYIVVPMLILVSRVFHK